MIDFINITNEERCKSLCHPNFEELKIHKIFHRCEIKHNVPET